MPSTAGPRSADTELQGGSNRVGGQGAWPRGCGRASWRPAFVMEDFMKRPLLLTFGIALLSVAALAAGDIPTRYAGSFPSSGSFTGISGTFTGKALALRYTFVGG